MKHWGLTNDCSPSLKKYFLGVGGVESLVTIHSKGPLWNYVAKGSLGKSIHTPNSLELHYNLNN